MGRPGGHVWKRSVLAKLEEQSHFLCALGVLGRGGGRNFNMGGIQCRLKAFRSLNIIYLCVKVSC